MSASRQTEQRRQQCIQDAIARVVGDAAAERLMAVHAEYPYPGEAEPESPVLKVRRLSLSAEGRARLAKARTWADVENI